MRTLVLYLNRMFLIRFAVIMFTVAGFAVLLDLLDTSTKVLRRTDGTLWSLAWYSAVRLPSLVTDLMPITVLLTSLVLVFDLMRHREFMVALSAGISRAGLMRRLLPAALLLCAAKLAIDDWAVPRTMPILRELGISEFGRVVGATENWLWLRSGDDVVRVPVGTRADLPLQDVLIFARDPEGRLIEQIRAASGTVEPGGWRLRGVFRQAASSAPPVHLPELFWPITLDAAHLETMAKLPRELPLRDLVGVVRAGGYGIAGIEGHRTWLSGRLAGAALTLIMTLLGFAFARRFSRRSLAVPLFGQGLAVGFVAMIAQGVLLAFGEVGTIAPEFAAWLVPAALLLFLILGTRRPRPLPGFGRPARLARSST